MNATTEMANHCPQPLDSGYESPDDYDELLLVLLVGQNSASSFTSNSSRSWHKGGAEPGSLQLTFDSLHICQSCCQNQHGKDLVNDSNRAATPSAHLPTAPYLTARNEDPHVAMFEDFFQIPTAFPNALQYYGLDSVQWNFRMMTGNESWTR